MPDSPQVEHVKLGVHRMCQAPGGGVGDCAFFHGLGTVTSEEFLVQCDGGRQVEHDLVGNPEVLNTTALVFPRKMDPGVLGLRVAVHDGPPVDEG